METDGSQPNMTGPASGGTPPDAPAPSPDQVAQELNAVLRQLADLFTPAGAPKPPHPRNPISALLFGRVRRRLYAEMNAYLSRVVELLMRAVRLSEALVHAQTEHPASHVQQLFTGISAEVAGISANLPTIRADLAAVFAELSKIGNKFANEVDPALAKIGSKFGNEVDPALLKIALLEERFEKELASLFTKVGLAVRYREESKSAPRSTHRQIFEDYAALTPDCHYGFDVLPEQKWRREKIFEASIPPALEVGCADGGITSYLTEKGKPTVGLDVALTYLRAAKKPGLYVAGDGRALPFLSGSFQTVILAEILEHVPKPREFISEALTVARRRIVVTIPESAPDPTHLWEIKPSQLRSILEDEFDLRVVSEANQGDFWVWVADKPRGSDAGDR